MKTIVENNRLIADFMGYETYEHTNSIAINIGEGNEFNSEVFGHIHTKFHESWEWLMSVVEKIENIQFNVEQSGGSCTIHPCVLKEPVFETYSTNRLEATYQAVIQFIEWYNEHKN
jgi:prolipoprotein diacylglyceryltransferase